MTEPSPAVRRNGLLQSCEPCRKAKIRCDHGRPVCGRCASKNIEPRCFYHPAPMTRAEAPAQSRVVKRQRNPPARPSSKSHHQVSSAVEYSRLRTTSEPALTTQGYLGSTSFSAILTEHRTEPPLSFDAESGQTGGTPSKQVDTTRLQAGVEVAKLLYHHHNLCDVLIGKFYSSALTAVVAITVLEAILRSVRIIFHGIDSSYDFETQLQSLVQRIFRSSTRPLVTHNSMTVEEYCAAFTGQNLRWEAVGLVFATAGVALTTTSEADPDLAKTAADNQTRELLRAQILEASSICLGFCDSAASVNELLGFYQYNDVMLRTQYYGDSSYQAWRRLSDLTATIYAAGLHQDSTTDASNCPRFLRQWRAICFASAFYVDKCLSTFVGRPPYINYRYCTLVPPLDLNDEVLIEGGDQLDKAISELDPTGWSKNRNHFRISMIRLRFLLSLFREQALEIALGTSFDWDLVQKANEVIAKAQEMWEACPERIRYDIHVKDPTEPHTTTFVLRHSYLDYLYSLFLIQRTIVKRTNTGQEALFDTSRRVLSIVVVINVERDPALDLCQHYSWIVLYYGLPSASVLTLELLRQTQEAGPPSVILPRAELIRNLSVFVSCLSWVSRPGQGNYRTCKAVEKKLSEILDQILDPHPTQSEMLDADDSNMQSLLDWYNPDNWDFNPCYLPLRDGFPF